MQINQEANWISWTDSLMATWSPVSNCRTAAWWRELLTWLMTIASRSHQVVTDAFQIHILSYKDLPLRYHGDLLLCPSCTPMNAVFLTYCDIVFDMRLWTYCTGNRLTIMWPLIGIASCAKLVDGINMLTRSFRHDVTWWPSLLTCARLSA